MLDRPNKNVSAIFQINKNKKIGIVASIFLIYFLYRIFINEEDKVNFIKSCLYDKWLSIYTNDFIIYLSQHLYIRDYLLFLSSNSLDILMISFLFYFVKWGNCEKTFLTLVIFYSFRGMIQNFFLFSFYDMYLFDYRDLISVVVPTGREADFFYSGHCGCALILCLTFREKKENIFYYYGIFVTITQAFVMSAVTRAHYSIDVIFGLIFGHYFYILSGRFIRFLKNGSS
jgi:hypothetical protein